MITIPEAEGILSQLNSTEKIQKISRRDWDSETEQMIDRELINCTAAEAREFLTQCEKTEKYVLLLV